VSTFNTHTVTSNNGHPHDQTLTTLTQGTTGHGQTTLTQGTKEHAGKRHTSPKSQNGHNHVVSTKRQGINGKTPGIRKSTFYLNPNHNAISNTRTTHSSKRTSKDGKIGHGHTKFPVVNNANQNAVGSTQQLHESGGGSYTGNGFMGGAGTAETESRSGHGLHKQRNTES
jgi:hypothetical protein